MSRPPRRQGTVWPGAGGAGAPRPDNAARYSLAVAKTTVFGLLIALIACHFGLRIEPNTESLGKGTTAAVVTSITVVILVDALFAIVFKDIGT